ncbi:MAG: hypothetical protein II751_03190, partial [Bacteroidales bacterium]|nr:hypothetical protein [Bacteroidales bacterium]
KIDLVPSGVMPSCHASQYDIGREIRFLLTDGGEEYTLAGTETISKLTLPSRLVLVCEWRQDGRVDRRRHNTSVIHKNCRDAGIIFVIGFRRSEVRR